MDERKTMGQVVGGVGAILFIIVCCLFKPLAVIALLAAIVLFIAASVVVTGTIMGNMNQAFSFDVCGFEISVVRRAEEDEGVSAADEEVSEES